MPDPSPLRNPKERFLLLLLSKDLISYPQRQAFIPTKKTRPEDPDGFVE